MAEFDAAGHLDDILAVIAGVLPTVVLVPEPGLPSWRELTGVGIEELPCETDVLRRWWRSVRPLPDVSVD